MIAALAKLSTRRRRSKAWLKQEHTKLDHEIIRSSSDDESNTRPTLKKSNITSRNQEDSDNDNSGQNSQQPNHKEGDDNKSDYNTGMKTLYEH